MADRPPVALVTGAGGGMASGITARLGTAGWHVAGVDVVLDGTERAAAAIRAAGGSASAHRSDLTAEASISALRDEVEERYGPVTLLVNAAGVLDRSPIGALDRAAFDRVLAINLTASVDLIRTFLPGMVRAGRGRIVNITSIAASHGYPYAAYAASKAALRQFGRALVSDLRGTGVTVNSISPGVVDTPMVIDAVRDQVARRVPTGALITPEEIGDAVVFLASDSARSITGADLVIDGGATQLLAFFED